MTSGGSEDGKFDDFRSLRKKFLEEVGDDVSKSADLYEVSMCFFTQFQASLVGSKSGRQ